MPQVKDMEELPIMQYREEIVSKVRNNPITLIFGGKTGCGKSTKIPQFIMDSCNKETCKIIVTQPRKIAAMTIAKRVSHERNCELGKEVGFQTSLMKKVSTNETKLNFCTTGVLLEKIIYGKSIDQYSHIILDEIHERSIDTDLLMNIIKLLLMAGTCDTKLILMSATLDLKKFYDYFSLRLDELRYEPAVVTIDSDMKYKIDIKFLEDLDLKISERVINYSVPSITTELYKVSAKLIKDRLNGSSKSILVFLPGIYEIETLRTIISADEDIKDSCLLIVLHSSLSTERQKEAFIRSTLPKVILSTNLAESSVTIPDVDCVIDFCLTKNMVCENSSFSTLKLEFASRNSCIQRAGRTGRICDGIVYRLIHKRKYDYMLLDENIPEMQRAPLENVFLRVKTLNIEKPIPFLNKCISPPEEKLVRQAVVKLKELGGLKLLEENDIFVTDDGYLTYIGKIMANLPIDVQLSKLIVLGYIYSVLDEVVVIASGLSIRNIFKCNYDQKLQDFLIRTRWSNGSGCDAVALLNAYTFWREEREKGTLRKYEDEQRFCNYYKLDRKNLNEMHLLAMKIQDRLKEFKMESLKGEKCVSWDPQEKSLIIKLCLAGAFLPNLFLKGKSDEDMEREAYKSVLGMDPNRTVFFRRMDREQVGIVYTERIKENLVHHGIADTTKGIKVLFDSTKVYVTFENRETMIDDENYDMDVQKWKSCLFSGCIEDEVYLGVKFRKTNKTGTFELKTLTAAGTKEYARRLDILEEVRGAEQVKKCICIFPGKIFMPSYNEKEMYGFVRHVEHCNKFYFYPTNDEGFLGDIEISLKNEAMYAPSSLEPEKLVVVFHEKYFKRAKIVNVYENQVDCFFFDYGYTKKIKFSDIYELSKEDTDYYFSMHECSFQCRLKEIAPSYHKCPRGKWTKSAIEDFRGQVLDGFCKIVVYSVVQDVCAVELFLDDKNINEYLIAKGYARKVEEPYSSKLNHNERVGVQSSITEWYPRAEEFKDKESNILSVSVKPPPLAACKTTIRLDGPYSALETQICDIAIKSRGSISVDPQSVNSVVLDEEIENYDGSLLVAAEVLNNNSGRGYTLYNVSSLPNIFELPVLIAMMFSPNMMFFTDDSNTRFIGVRFGLGYNPNTLKAYNFEQDCYLPINYQKEFHEDVQDINYLRFTMSTLISTDPEVSELTEDEKYELMKDVKKLVLKILTKKRTRVESTSFYPNSDPKWESSIYSKMLFSNDVFKSGPFCSIQLPSLANTSA